MQRIAQVAGPALGRGLVAVGAMEQVLEVLAPDPPLDLGELALLGDGERKHQRRLLDRHEGELLVVRRVVQDGDVAEHLVGGQDRRDQALARHAEVGERRDLDRPPLRFNLPQHALDLRVEEHSLRRALAEDRLLAVGVGAAARVSEQVEACIFDHDRALEEVGQRAADLVHALAVEDELGEPVVDLDRSLESPVLGVDDPLEQGGHQVDELDIRGNGEKGDLQAVRLGDHLGRQLAQVGQWPYDQSRSAGVCDPGDQPDLRREVVLDREAAGEHEVAGTRLHLWRLHQPDPLHLAVKPVGAGDQLRLGEHGSHRLAHGRPGLLDLLTDLLRGHDCNFRVWAGDRQARLGVVPRALGVPRRTALPSRHEHRREPGLRPA